MEHKIFVLSYEGYKHDYRINLGDEIQTISASRLLPKVDGYVSREALNKVNEKCIVSLNGFFMSSNNWPPSKNVIPIPFAFHIARKSEKEICSPEGLEYLKKYQPIGCRDMGTVNILQRHGIESYFSRCLTLTLDARVEMSTQNKICIVGLDKDFLKLIPKNLSKNAIFINQSNINLPFVSPDTKMHLAESLLDFYRKNACLVITQKIHCAMPCIAMGIPVIFIWDKARKNDYRVKTLDGICKINYVNKFLLRFPLVSSIVSKWIDWNPEAPDIGAIKQSIKQNYLSAYELAKKRFYE